MRHPARSNVYLARLWNILQLSSSQRIPLFLSPPNSFSPPSSIQQKREESPSPHIKCLWVPRKLEEGWGPLKASPNLSVSKLDKAYQMSMWGYFFMALCQGMNRGTFILSQQVLDLLWISSEQRWVQPQNTFRETVGGTAKSLPWCFLTVWWLHGFIASWTLKRRERNKSRPTPWYRDNVHSGVFLSSHYLLCVCTHVCGVCISKFQWVCFVCYRLDITQRFIFPHYRTISYSDGLITSSHFVTYSSFRLRFTCGALTSVWTRRSELKILIVLSFVCGMKEPPQWSPFLQHPLSVL